MVSKVRENVKDFLNALFSVPEPQNYPNEINETTDSFFLHFRFSRCRIMKIGNVKTTRADKKHLSWSHHFLKALKMGSIYSENTELFSVFQFNERSQYLNHLIFVTSSFNSRSPVIS